MTDKKPPKKTVRPSMLKDTSGSSAAISSNIARAARKSNADSLLRKF